MDQIARRESLEHKVVMVTGGAGFIGSHLCESILRRGPKRLVIVDDFSLGKKANITHLVDSGLLTVYTSDASHYPEMSEIFEREKIEVVFNLAVVPLPASLEMPKRCIDTNVLITSTICELLREGKFKTLIHCSSSEAYGSAIYVPMDESHPIKPLTPYAASKIASDYVALSYQITFGLDIAIVRPFNTYGPRQNEGTYAGLVPATIKRIMADLPPIIQGDGLQTRDYSYVEDIAEAIPRMYEELNTRGLVVNLASGQEIAIRDLIRTIIDLMGYSGKVVFENARPGDVRRHRGDISLARSLINYSPSTDYVTGLRKTIEWYMAGLR